jgi:hypothetical protein
VSRRRKNKGPKATLPADQEEKVNAELWNEWMVSETEEELTGDHDVTLPSEMAKRIVQPPQLVQDISAGRVSWDQVQSDWVRVEEKAESGKALNAKLDVHIAKLEESNARFRATVAVLGASLHSARHEQATKRAQSVLGWLEVIVPRRLNKEDVGDAMEQITAWASDPTCRQVRTKIAIKVASAIVFAGLNTFRYLVASLTGKKTD